LISKFGYIEASNASRQIDFESENTKLKKLLAKAHLDIHVLKSVFGAKR
jgi:putative transposase